MAQLQKIRGALPNNDGAAVRLDENSRFLVDAYRASRFRPAVVHDAREESQRSSHAPAFGEMAVRDDAAQSGNGDESPVEREFAVERIRKSFGAGDCIVPR